MTGFNKALALFTLTASLTLSGCGESENVSAKSFGDQWPFTVESGRLECTRNGAVLFHSDGVAYTVYAPREHAGAGLLIDTILKHPDIRPSYAEGLAPIIERGLELCKES